MNIIFLGPPGSGKGTQAQLLVDSAKLTHLSTGDIFRDAIKGQTPLGMEIKAFVDAGKLVPDELVSKVVFEKIGSLPKPPSFLLDGYPRTVDQARALDVFAKKNGIAIGAVLFFDVAFDELVKRLSARRQCGSCKEVYNVLTKPPKRADICDRCVGALIQRPDDKAEVVQERLKIYSLQTAPVLDFYKGQPNFHSINAAQDMQMVLADVKKALGI